MTKAATKNQHFSLYSPNLFVSLTSLKILSLEKTKEKSFFLCFFAHLFVSLPSKSKNNK